MNLVLFYLVVESGVHFLWFLLVRSSSVVGSNYFLILSDVALFLGLMRKSHDLESAFWRTIGRASSLISISIGVFVYSSSKFELRIYFINSSHGWFKCLIPTQKICRSYILKKLFTKKRLEGRDTSCRHSFFQDYKEINKT